MAIFMPPGSAKSTSASILFSPRYLSHAPGDRLARARNVLAASHTTELAAASAGGYCLAATLNPASPALHATPALASKGRLIR